MKKTISLLLGLFCSAYVFAQDYERIFDQFQQSAQKGMEQFQEKTREAFLETLAHQWEQFQVFEAEPRPVKPKPLKRPVAPVGGKPEDIRIPVLNPEKEPLILPEITVDPFAEEDIDAPDLVPLDIPEMHVDPIKRKETVLSFYSVPVSFPELTSVQGERKPRLTSIEESKVAKFWRALENGKNNSSFASQVLPLLAALRREYDLNDWTLYRLVAILAEYVWNDVSEQAVAEVFLLNHLGINARIGRVDNHLSLMFPACQQIYAKPYITVGGEKYFIQDKGKVSTVFTYGTRYSETVKPMEVALIRADRIFDLAKPRMVVRNLPNLQTTVQLPICQPRCDFYMDFPQLPVEQYARTYVNESFGSELLKQLEFLRKLEKKENAVFALMRCIQKDFDYATDDEQFGFEKPFFLEENFVYPMNDCEDRSILLAYLVKSVLNLDVVLLDYPQHIATAICFGDTDVPGAYLMHKGKKYVICDPTYIGAGIGMVMPQFRDTPAKVL